MLSLEECSFRDNFFKTKEQKGIFLDRRTEEQILESNSGYSGEAGAKGQKRENDYNDDYYSVEGSTDLCVYAFMNRWNVVSL